MSAELPVVLITPQARAALEAEAERSVSSGDVIAGLLFGHPLDDRHRLVVAFCRPRPEVGFGQKGFSLEQSRTSQQLAEARKLARKAHYCGVWFVHCTPTGELTDEEWVQAQAILEDPDYRFKDLVCLVICLYTGELNMYALSFNLEHSAHGQLPAPTVLRIAREAPGAPGPPSPPESAEPVVEPAGWHNMPDVAVRLKREGERLAQRYRVETALTREGQAVFRVMPKGEHQDMVFYLACEAGFPQKAPVAFTVLRGDRYPLLSPELSEWSDEKWLVEVADDVLAWQLALLDQQIAEAEEALDRGDYQEASDVLAAVLLIYPRKPGAARLLARVQAIVEPGVLEQASRPSQTTAHVGPGQVEAPYAFPADWYRASDAAARLRQEQERLAQKYRVESAVTPEGQVIFRLMPTGEHGDMVFHLACTPGFPEMGPVAFLSIRGDRYPLLSPSLLEWSEAKSLIEVADDLVEWQVCLLDEQIAAAKEALDRGDYREASDLLAMVLLIEPRMPGAARLLAQAQSRLGASLEA